MTKAAGPKCSRGRQFQGGKDCNRVLAVPVYFLNLLKDSPDLVLDSNLGRLKKSKQEERLVLSPPQNVLVRRELVEIGVGDKTDVLQFLLGQLAVDLNETNSFSQMSEGVFFVFQQFDEKISVVLSPLFLTKSHLKKNETNF